MNNTNLYEEANFSSIFVPIKKKVQKCMVRGCNNSSLGGARGLCNKHYSLLKYRVDKGIFTWEELERKGVCKSLKNKKDNKITRLDFFRNVNKQFEEKVSKYPKCMYSGCNRTTYDGGRGLCKNHLVKYARQVKTGTTSWEQLENEGKTRRKLTQKEKNDRQSHSHIYHRQTKKELDPFLISPAQESFKKKVAKHPKCMYPGCDETIYNGGRGLCKKHLVKYAGQVKKGITSWEQLEKEGKTRRKMTQVEKNIGQSHPSLTYRKKNNNKIPTHSLTNEDV